MADFPAPTISAMAPTDSSMGTSVDAMVVVEVDVVEAEPLQ